MRAKAWNNGAHHASGAGYGLKISATDRDRHFSRDWPVVILDIPGEGAATVQLSDSFWRNCRELRSSAIGRWLRRAGQAPWPSGIPPEIELAPLDGNRFAVRNRAS